MRDDWPEAWWGAMLVCALGLTAEAVAATEGYGPFAFLGAAIIAVVALRLWRVR